MKRVMLLGDSIRQNYQDIVKEELKGKYYVWAPEENCRFAKYTLNEIQRYIEAFSQKERENVEEGELTLTIDKADDLVYPDIIHWNNGLWDTGIAYEEDGPFTSINDYIRDMSRILRELRKMTKKVIFATITPVKPGTHQRNEIIQEYNEKITEFMKRENVYINDLSAIVSKDVEKYISEDKIHLSKEGKIVCGMAAARCIREIDDK